MVSPKIFINSIGQAYKVAPFGRRVWAFIIDFICISLIGLFIMKIMDRGIYFYSLHGDLGNFSYSLYDNVRYMVLNEFSMFCIIGFSYHVIAEQSSWKGSFGKRILGIMVVNKHTEKPYFVQSLLRNFFKFAIILVIPIIVWQFFFIFSPLIFVIWVVLLLMTSGDKYNRFLSDFPTQSFVLLRKR